MQEQNLIARSQEGGLDAFNHLVELCQASVYNPTFRVLDSAARAKNASQETLISAFSRARAFHGGSFHGWPRRSPAARC